MSIILLKICPVRLGKLRKGCLLLHVTGKDGGEEFRLINKDVTRWQVMILGTTVFFSVHDLVDDLSEVTGSNLFRLKASYGFSSSYIYFGCGSNHCQGNSSHILRTHGWANVHSPLNILDRHMTNAWPHIFRKFMTHLSGIKYHTTLEYRLFMWISQE